MKRILTYLSSFVAGTALIFSCSPLPEDNSHVDEVVKAPEVQITVSEITDYTATVTIAPAGAAAYYSYVIDQSAVAAELDPDALYANKYSSVANGLVKYAANASTTIVLDDLDPNTTYQVYAVAGSTTGVVGTIAVKAFTTGDTGNPAIVAVQRSGNVVAAAFSEAVTYKDSKPATAKYYAYNLSEVSEEGKLVSTGEMGEAHVSVSTNGAAANFTVTLDGTNPLPDGAYFTVAFPEGAFVDAVGNPLPAMNHITGVTSSGTMGFGGLYGRIPVKAFELVDDPEKTMAIPSEEYQSYKIPEGVQVYEMADGANATITVVSSSAAKTSTVEYKLAAGQDWGYSRSLGVVVFYPEGFEISGGDNFTVKIGEGSFVDIYGNGNAALEHSYLYSYNYDITDILGTYTFSGETHYAGPQESTVIIAPDPEGESETDVLIYDLFKDFTAVDDIDGFEAFGDPLAASVDLDGGILSIHYDAIGIGVLNQYGWQNYVLAAKVGETAYEDFRFSIPEAGKMELMDQINIVLYQLGTWDYYTDGMLVRTSAEYTVPETSTTAKTSFGRPVINDFVVKSLR